MRLSSLAGELAELFLPTACLGCGEVIPPEAPFRLVCTGCRLRLRPPPPPRCPRCHIPRGTGHDPAQPCLECAAWPELLLGARSASVLGPSARQLVHALKYGGWRSLAPFMATLMASLPLPPLSGEPLVVPVPTTRQRERARGYNQAGLLAEAVARELDLPLAAALERPQGGSQVRLRPGERASNVQGAFRLRPPNRSRIRGREVILVDDVLTTGATALSAVRTLGEAEVRGVVLLTFARALPFS